MNGLLWTQGLECNDARQDANHCCQPMIRAWTLMLCSECFKTNEEACSNTMLDLGLVDSPLMRDKALALIWNRDDDRHCQLV